MKAVKALRKTSFVIPKSSLKQFDWLEIRQLFLRNNKAVISEK